MTGLYFNQPKNASLENIEEFNENNYELTTTFIVILLNLARTILCLVNFS